MTRESLCRQALDRGDLPRIRRQPPGIPPVRHRWPSQDSSSDQDALSITPGGRSTRRAAFYRTDASDNRVLRRRCFSRGLVLRGRSPGRGLDPNRIENSLRDRREFFRSIVGAKSGRGGRVSTFVREPVFANTLSLDAPAEISRCGIPVRWCDGEGTRGAAPYLGFGTASLQPRLKPRAWRGGRLCWPCR